MQNNNWIKTHLINTFPILCLTLMPLNQNSSISPLQTCLHSFPTIIDFVSLLLNKGNSIRLQILRIICDHFHKIYSTQSIHELSGYDSVPRRGRQAIPETASETKNRSNEQKPKWMFLFRFFVCLRKYTMFSPQWECIVLNHCCVSVRPLHFCSFLYLPKSIVIITMKIKVWMRHYCHYDKIYYDSSSYVEVKIESLIFMRWIEFSCHLSLFHVSFVWLTFY